jgi:hypothetical protein
VDYLRLYWNISIKSPEFYKTKLFDEMIHYWPISEEFNAPKIWKGSDRRIGLNSIILLDTSLEEVITILQNSCDLEFIFYKSENQFFKFLYISNEYFTYVHRGDLERDNSISIWKDNFKDIEKVYSQNYPLSLKIELIEHFNDENSLISLYNQEVSYQIKNTIIHRLKSLNYNIENVDDSCLFIKEISELNHEVLLNFISNDPDIETRIIALQKISSIDISTLKKIALSGDVNELKLSKLALTKLIEESMESAYTIFKQAPLKEQRIYLIDYINDEELLLEIAINDQEEIVRMKAYHRISNNELIQDLMISTPDYWLVRDYIELIEDGQVTSESILPTIKQQNYSFDEDKRELEQEKIIRIALYQPYEHIRRLAIPRIKNQAILVDLFTQEQSIRNKELVINNMVDKYLLTSLLLISDEYSRDLIRNRLIELKIEEIDDRNELIEIVNGDSNSKLRFYALKKLNMDKTYYLNLILRRVEDENITMHCLSKLNDDDYYLKYLHQTMVPRFVDDVLELITDKSKLMQAFQSIEHPLIKRKIAIHLRLQNEITRYILREDFTNVQGLLKYITQKELIEEIVLRAYDINIRHMALHKIMNVNQLISIYVKTSQIDLKDRILQVIKNLHPDALQKLMDEQILRDLKHTK